MSSWNILGDKNSCLYCVLTDSSVGHLGKISEQATSHSLRSQGATTALAFLGCGFDTLFTFPFVCVGKVCEQKLSFSIFSIYFPFLVPHFRIYIGSEYSSESSTSSVEPTEKSTMGFTVPASTPPHALFIILLVISALLTVAVVIICITMGW